MRIIELRLVKYKRMMRVNNISSFTIRPAQMIQLILGTNGSGKSSLIKELTPLPADPSDYEKDGSKTIRLIHNGHSYLLTSTFAPTTKHYFEIDGEEKNPGGTITVQKELVRQEFGITAEIHELITGMEHFTSMPTTRRREWFTQLSDINYDYALLVYKRLKERHRDYTGALRTAKKHLVSETSKVVSAAEEAKLRADVETTHRELQVLINQSSPLDRPVAAYEEDQRQGLDELNKMSTKLLRMRLMAPYGTTAYGTDPRLPMTRDEWGESIQPTFKNLDEIEDYLNLLRHDITGKEVLINKAVSEHGKINETVKVLMRTGEEGVKSLQSRLETLRSKKSDILSQRRLKIEGFDPLNALGALDSVRDLLTSTFSAIPSNEDQRFSGLRVKQLTEQELELKDVRNRMNNDLARHNSHRAHMEAHKASGNSVCPKCNHSWVAGYSDTKYDELLANIAKREEDVAAQEKLITKNNDEAGEIRAYGELYRDYSRCVKNWPVLNPFWDYLLETRMVTESPRKVLGLVEALRFDLDLEVTVRKLEDEMNEVMNLMQAAEQVGDANLNDQRLKLEECAFSIDQMTAELGRLQASVGQYSQYKRQLMEAFDLSARITQLTSNLEKTTTDMVEMMRRETLNHCMRQLQLTLAMKQETLSAIELKKGIIADLEGQIKQLTVDEEAAKILVRELSPTDGLIAENLLGFIRKFVGQMNALIRKIWSYPLQVMDCGVSSAEGAELDYKFPLMVQTKDNVVPDIKMGSTGMREIVNLAFKVTAMRYLGLSEFPLFLDEFGASFDEAHRSAAGITIKNLMESQQFTQLFMVSHYESTHGAFTNAEVCVLCASNITVPLDAKYNKHVQIQH